ncbi:hypothetical protein DPMN_022166 [Dreissena polymorpha]|uniref:Uncharacterized protein n=1 Tax=Dreissena polymorpha TaxID=45954 RepID=A0A9D4NNY8_DREPO|nr:hypothetical protein DPMN_022166 [Dreissena polymorpha]
MPTSSFPNISLCSFIKLEFRVGLKGTSVTDTKSYSSSYGNANSQLLLLDITTNIMKNKKFNNLFQSLWDKQKLNGRKSRNNKSVSFPSGILLLLIVWTTEGLRTAPDCPLSSKNIIIERTFEHPEHNTSVLTLKGSNDLVVNTQSTIHPC